MKKKWRLWQQMVIDAKGLCDIPEYWEERERLGLPRYQYTARVPRPSVASGGRR